MVGKAMARKDWIYVNLDKPLMRNVEKVVEKSTAYGTKEYRDQKDFVTKAIQQLLEREVNRKPSLEVTV